MTKLVFNALTGTFDLVQNLSGYALLAGRAGGQVLVGGSAVTDALVLQGTSGNGTLASPSVQLKVGNNGGTVAMTALNNGNVGIGTTTPLAALDVNGVTRALSSAGTAPTGGIGLEYFYKASTDTGNIYSYDRTNSIYKDLNLNDKVRIIGSSGNVGIGTTGPIAKLHVATTTSAPTDSTATMGLVVGGYDSITTGNSYAGIFGSARGGLYLGSKYTGGAINTGNIQFITGNLSTTDGNAATIASITGNQTTGDATTGGELKFKTRIPSGALTDRLIINSTGNVGIGTTSPGAKLHVISGVSGVVNPGANVQGIVVENNGTANSSYTFRALSSGNLNGFNITNAGNVGLGIATPLSKFQLGSSLATGSSTDIGLSVNGVTNSATIGALRTASNDSADLVLSTFNGTTLSEKMRVLSSGNVGIGTTSPTAVLHLKAGTATANTAPLKLTSGTLLTTAEAGAVEFLTDDFFATITTGAARKAFVLDDGTRLTSGRIPFATTNGRLTDDADLTFATDTLTATKMVGTTSIKVGTAGGYLSSDGSAGATGTFTTVDGKTCTVKDGLITSIV